MDPIVETQTETTQTTTQDTQPTETTTQPDEVTRIRERLGLGPKEEAKKDGEPEKPEQVDTTELSAQAQLARLDREHRKKVAKWEAERTAKEKEFQDKEAALADLTPVQEARKRLKESQPGTPERAQALLDLAGAELSIDDIATLTELMGAEKPSLTVEEAKRIAREELKAEQEAEKKRQEEAEKARQLEITTKESNLVQTGALPFFEANTEKYPTVAFRGVSGTKIVELMREGYKATGQIPAWGDIFDYLETEFRKEASEKLAPVITPAAPPPPRTISASDKRGVTPSKVEEPAPTERKPWREEKKTALDELKAKVRAATGGK